jgi:hypothetical protein
MLVGIADDRVASLVLPTSREIGVACVVGAAEEWIIGVELQESGYVAVRPTRKTEFESGKEVGGRV